MPSPERYTQASWHDIQVEAAAQFSALCLQVGTGRYPWQEQGREPAQAPVVKAQPTRTAFAYDLLVV